MAYFNCHAEDCRYHSGEEYNCTKDYVNIKLDKKAENVRCEEYKSSWSKESMVQEADHE